MVRCAATTCISRAGAALMGVNLQMSNCITADSKAQQRINCILPLLAAVGCFWRDGCVIGLKYMCPQQVWSTQNARDVYQRGARAMVSCALDATAFLRCFPAEVDLWKAPLSSFCSPTLLASLPDDLLHVVASGMPHDQMTCSELSPCKHYRLLQQGSAAPSEAATTQHYW